MLYAVRAVILAPFRAVNRVGRSAAASFRSLIRSASRQDQAEGERLVNASQQPVVVQRRLSSRVLALRAMTTPLSRLAGAPQTWQTIVNYGILNNSAQLQRLCSEFSRIQDASSSNSDNFEIHTQPSTANPKVTRVRMETRV